MTEEFLDDLMVFLCRKDIYDMYCDDDVTFEFEMSRPHRVKFN